MSSCLTPICFLNSESLIRNISFSASFFARCALEGGSISSSSSTKSFLFALVFISLFSIFPSACHITNRPAGSSSDKTACLRVYRRQQEESPFSQGRRQRECGTVFAYSVFSIPSYSHADSL